MRCPIDLTRLPPAETPSPSTPPPSTSDTENRQ